MAYFTVILVAMSCLVLAKAGNLTDIDINMILPKECEGMIFCDVEPEDYPHIYFDEYVREMQRKNNFMLMREVPIENLIPKRFNDEENCSTETTVIYPFIVKSNTTTKLVVQSKYFKQKVTQTRCLHNRAPCFQSIKGLGYTSTCEEKYGEIQLYLYDPIDKTIKYEFKRVPVCCRCTIARNMK